MLSTLPNRVVLDQHRQRLESTKNTITKKNQRKHRAGARREGLPDGEAVHLQ